MVKKVIGMKLEEAEITQLKKKAKLNGLTITDLLMQGIKESEKNLFLQEQITDLQNKIKDLESKTNHKIQDKQYISIPVSRVEKEKIRKLAFENRTSQGMFVRELLSKSGVLAVSEVKQLK